MIEGSSELELLRQALNQVDYGMVVVDVDSCAIVIANGLGRGALEGTLDAHGNRHHATGLRVEQGRLATCRPGDGAQLWHMLRRTRNGLRGLLTLGSSEACAIAVVPLTIPEPHTPPSTGYGPNQAPTCHALLVFAKQQLCDSSTMALFARDRGLTSAEAQVLAQVCRGLRPAQIADVHGVQISTVRTQLRNIRLKTSCDTIGEVVQKVSVLPPMARYLSGQLAGTA